MKDHMWLRRRSCKLVNFLLCLELNQNYNRTTIFEAGIISVNVLNLCSCISITHVKLFPPIKMTELKRTGNGCPAIGIDLGTTYCAVAVNINGKIEIIPNHEQGKQLTPSYVAYLPDGTETYGFVAKMQAYKFPENTIYDTKRMIGRPWTDDVLQKDIASWPFEVVEMRGVPKVKVGSKTRHPQEISAKLLSIFCRRAEKHLQKNPGTITKAVITVPAYFTEGQRRATIEAGEAAGLQVLTILNEPTAAAIAYKFNRLTKEARTALIYDLGGGTFDVAIVRVTEDKVETLGVDGDTHLGGEDFDWLLVEYCAAEFKKETGIDILQPSKEFYRAWARLRVQCEIAKQALSSCDSTFVDVQAIHDGKDLNVTVTRQKFEELLSPFLNGTMDIVDRAINQANGIKSKDDIDDIILIGGSTRIPLVSNLLQNYFTGKSLNVAIDPDEAVAYGAAVQAAILNEDANRSSLDDFEISDVTPMSLGIETRGGKLSVMIAKNTKFPCSATDVFTTVFDDQTTIRVKVFQGENEKVAENKKLAEFSMDVPPRPAKEERVEVTMSINTNGILNVTATSHAHGITKSVRVVDDRSRMDHDTINSLAQEVSDE